MVVLVSFMCVKTNSEVTESTISVLDVLVCGSSSRLLMSAQFISQTSVKRRQPA